MNSEDEFVPIGFDIKQFESGSDPESEEAPEREVDKHGFPITLQYKHLLNKAMKHLEEIRQETVTKSKIPLDIRKEGGKVSFNMKEIANHLNREEDHLTKFVINELSTTGNTNSEGRLLIKGRFSKKQIQEVLKAYVDQFVVCKSCFKSDCTDIVKENRMFFLKCSLCGASRHVGNISEGYFRK